MDHDEYFTDNEVEAAEGDLLTRLTRLADKLDAAEKAVEGKEAELREAQSAVRLLAEQTIPGLMDEAGIEEFCTKSGLRIRVSEDRHPNVKVESRPTFFRWLEANGHGGMIKRTIVVAFSKGQQDQAMALKESLQGRGFPAKTEEEVHHSTLKAWVTRRLADGEEVPDLVNLNPVRAAKIER